MFRFIKNWFSCFWSIFAVELKSIFSDGGVLIIFLGAGLFYPIIYNFMYKNGVLNDTPVAVVDYADCRATHEFIREVDATREVQIAYTCVNMEEAKGLMADRKVNGILYFPSDFGDKIMHRQTAKLSIYADMSSFLYYKNVLMGTEFVMLDKMHKIQIEHYEAAGKTQTQAERLVQAIPYDENNPWNRTFSYSVFLLSAIVMLIIQQTMFYGMSLLAGTRREEHRSFAGVADEFVGNGMGRIVLARSAAYWLVYLGIGIYNACIIPSLFGLPQRGDFWDILVLLMFFVTACVFFCMAWSTLVTRRESVFVLLLFISPIALFLTGFSWPDCAFPPFWKYFSYLFPSTFACKAFINLNTAGGDLSTIRMELLALTSQAVIYYIISCVAVFVEGKIVKNRIKIEQAKDRIAKRMGIDQEKDVEMIAGEAAVEELKEKLGR